MQNVKNLWLSLGAALVTSKFAQLVSGLELDDVLKPVGLARRESRWPANLAYLVAGVAVGGVAALLLAPASGEATRARLAKKAGELGEAALKASREVSQELRDEVGALRAQRGNGESPTRSQAT
jgi:hypothetical protein